MTTQYNIPALAMCLSATSQLTLLHQRNFFSLITLLLIRLVSLTSDSVYILIYAFRRLQ